MIVPARESWYMCATQTKKSKYSSGPPIGMKTCNEGYLSYEPTEIYARKK